MKSIYLCLFCIYIYKIYIFVRLCVGTFIRTFVHPSIRPSIHISIHTSIGFLIADEKKKYLRRQTVELILWSSLINWINVASEFFSFKADRSSKKQKLKVYTAFFCLQMINELLEIKHLASSHSFISQWRKPTCVQLVLRNVLRIVYFYIL